MHAPDPSGKDQPDCTGAAFLNPLTAPAIDVLCPFVDNKAGSGLTQHRALPENFSDLSFS